MEHLSLERRLDAGALTVVSVLGVLCAGGALAWGCFSFVNTLTNETVPVLQPTVVDVGTAATTGTASITGGETTLAELSVDGLSTAARLLLGGGGLVLALVQVMIAIAVVVLCRQLRAGRPFVPALGRLVSAAAVVVLVGGLVGQALYGFGNFQVAAELSVDPVGTRFPMMMHLDATPIAVGVVLALIAMAFAAGERLQRETDGLV